MAHGSKYNLIYLFIGGIIFIAYLLYTNPFTELTKIGRFNYAVYVFAVTINWIGLVSYSASWHLLLQALDVKIPFIRTLQITLVSMFIVFIFPIPSGVEIIRAALVRDEKGSSTGKAVSSVIISKVYYFISFGALITTAAFIVTVINSQSVPINPLIVWFVVLYGVANVVILSLFLAPRQLKRVYDRSPLWVKRNIFDRLFAQSGGESDFKLFIGELDEAVKSLRNKPMINLFSLVCVGFQWSSASITAWLVIDSFKIDVSFWAVVLIFAFVELIQQLNLFIPGGLGIVDAGLTGAFVILGIPLGTAAAISLLTRLATYWFELIPAAAVSFLFGYSETIRNIANSKRSLTQRDD